MNKVHIKDPEGYSLKLKNIKESGAKNLHIVTDFDRTLTTFNEDGAPGSTSWSIFTQTLPASYIQSRNELFEYYRPIELDTSLDTLFRSQKMQEWWIKHLNLLIENKLTKYIVEDIAKKAKIKLRDGTKELFEFASTNDIPLLIFSAGIGDIVHHVLNGYLDTQNVHIISNFFTYSNDEYITGFRDDVIHSLNKDERSIQNQPYFNSVTDRKNCILLGDTLTDADMTKGIEHNTILKIGFLNGDVTQLDSFMNVYDIVVEDSNDAINLSEIIN